MKTIHDIFDGIEADTLKYEDEMMYDPEATRLFVKQSLERNAGKGEIRLPVAPLDLSRKSIREFDTEKLVRIPEFSDFLNVLRMEETRFSFPSAGGLYPIDVYLYVKDGRVENLGQGLYQYLPEEHSLRMINREVIPVTTHYYGNRSIFHTSAFSLFFFYNAKFSYPKYAGMGLYYGILDCGIMLQQLSSSACSRGLGSCIIGDLDAERIREHFGLNRDMVYLCCMEAGVPARGGRDE
ncbi:MAG: SagB/ThcOx family dehydrogenase [Eubacterium sp.]|nr:SagB/ThcOx family dehydrogenase [Eubacterium sp.]